MRKVIEETDEQPFDALMNCRVMVRCMNWIYAGKLVAVNDVCLFLDDASIVYDTGSEKTHGYETEEKLPCQLGVMFSAIESFNCEV